MGKYDPLQKFLKEVPSGEKVLTLSFAQIEQILGESLPPSAYEHRAWWSNNAGKTHPQGQEWRSVGWEVDEVHQQDHWVRFRRQR